MNKHACFHVHHDEHGRAPAWVAPTKESVILPTAPLPAAVGQCAGDAMLEMMSVG